MNRIVSYELSPHKASIVFAELSYSDLIGFAKKLEVWKKRDIDKSHAELSDAIIRRVRKNKLVDRFLEILLEVYKDG